jgi:DNA-binding MarR family transcriptional regulator
MTMDDDEILDAEATPGTVDLGALTQMTGYALRRAQIWLFRDLKARFKSHDVSLAQFSVLYVVDVNPGLAQARIAEALAIERARLVLMLDRLELRGLLVRSRSKSDRRSHALHLTPAGRDLLQILLEVQAEHEKRITMLLGSDGRSDLIRLLSPFQD